MSLSLSGSWLSHCSDCYRRREKNRNDTKYTASAYTRRKLEFKIKCKLPSGIFCPGYWLDNKGSTLTCDFNNPAPYPSLHPIPAGCERDRCMEVKLEELSGYKRTRVNKFIKTEKGDWQPESKIELKCAVWCLRGEESETAELAVWVRFCHGCSFFFGGGGVLRVNGFHLPLQTIVWYPFVYTCATVPEYESFLPLGIDTIFISVSLASSAQKDYTYLPCHITVRLHLTLQLGVIRDLFSPRAFVPQQCLCPTVQGPRDSVCVFIFLNRKQRNGSESEYTEKLQQYSKSLR